MKLMLLVVVAIAGCAGQEPDEPAVAATESELDTACGNGSFTYYDWVCSWGAGGFRWRLEEVGYSVTSCETPHVIYFEGRSTRCYFQDEMVCGGGHPICERYRCDITRPSDSLCGSIGQ